MCGLSSNYPNKRRGRCHQAGVVGDADPGAPPRPAVRQCPRQKQLWESVRPLEKLREPQQQQHKHRQQPPRKGRGAAALGRASPRPASRLVVPGVPLPLAGSAFSRNGRSEGAARTEQPRGRQSRDTRGRGPRAASGGHRHRPSVRAGRARPRGLQAGRPGLPAPLAPFPGASPADFVANRSSGWSSCRVALLVQNETKSHAFPADRDVPRHFHRYVIPQLG